MEKNNPNSSTTPDGLLRPPTTEIRSQATTSDFVLQWGNRKRLRCMKVQAKENKKDSGGPAPVQRSTVRGDRRVVRSDHNSKDSVTNAVSNNGYITLRQRPVSPAPQPHRVLRNSESSIAMKGQSNGGGGRIMCSPDRGAHDKRGAAATTNHHLNTPATGGNSKVHNSNNNHHHGGGGGGSGSTETGMKGGGGSSSGSDAVPAVWPPKFVIGLTNKEKEEDFMAIKGSKLPQRPKKRAKFIQRTLNLVSPGAWLCDLTLERYEVREKKISKKRPQGLKAMGNMESDSE